MESGSHRHPHGRRRSGSWPPLSVLLGATVLVFIVGSPWGCTCIGLHGDDPQDDDAVADDDSTPDDDTNDDDDDSQVEYLVGYQLRDAPGILMSREFGGLGSQFGANGDVNGDGRSDLVVNAPNLALDGEERGVVYVVTEPVYGSVYADEAATAMIQGTLDWEVLGWGTDFAGDVDGDGYDDVLAGAPYLSEDGMSTGGTEPGGAYLFAGPLEGTLDTTSARARFAGDEPSANFGEHLTGAGDVNGDGYDDVLIAAWTAPSGDANGLIYLFLGPLEGVVPVSSAVARFRGEQQERTGEALSGPYDFGGDGLYDVVVASLIYGVDPDDPENYSNWNGRVSIITQPDLAGYGDLGAAADVELYHDSDGEQFGTSVHLADFDADGLAEIVVGAYEYSGQGYDSQGAVYVFPGTIDEGGHDGGEAMLKLYGDLPPSLAGSTVSSGDINGDGHRDLLIGAPGMWGNEAPDWMGSVYLLKGPLPEGEMSLAEVDARFVAEESKDGTGYIDLAADGDLNGDGFDDLVVGAYLYDDWSGRVYIWYGSEDM